ncbi:hypothetical protein BDV33DRAFT_199028 [Aspergillus novoparasiticus]|uniref:Uncharacterized protein n=1 Tax=Aspergillus novoparasiticus TaxID=986946 RepID=A0A5N6F6D5_9EURO|nr:hypothetical protein BDV33DRAFT_199028 [Aspergillus novoparasiticus]
MQSMPLDSRRLYDCGLEAFLILGLNSQIHLKVDLSVSKALSTDPEEISSLLSEDLFALHPEYSKVPPAMPTEFPSCTSKLVKVSIHRINVLNETLCNYMPMHRPQVYCSAHSSGRLLPECEPTAIQLSQAKRVD